MVQPHRQTDRQADQIVWSGIGGRRDSAGRGVVPVLSTWGYNLSHRLGVELLGLLEQGAKGPIHAVVKTTEYDAGMQAPTSVIRGDGYSQLEIAVVGHLFEHIAKQGALDDASGSAVALEMARAWVQLIRDGAVLRPHRTIRFLWVDGT